MPEVHNDGTTCIKNKVISRICLERVVPLVGYVCICVAMGPGRAHSRPSLGLGDVSHFLVWFPKLPWVSLNPPSVAHSARQSLEAPFLFFYWFSASTGCLQTRRTIKSMHFMDFYTCHDRSRRQGWAHLCIWYGQYSTRFLLILVLIYASLRTV